MQSMTGFASCVAEVPEFGKVSVELRSSNHKFLEIVFHMPPGFLSFEEKIKKEMEAYITRGRITCAVTVVGGEGSAVRINKSLVKYYIGLGKELNEDFGISGSISVDTLLHLPGVLVQDGNAPVNTDVWQRIKPLVNKSIAGLVATRTREGKSLHGILQRRARQLNADLTMVKARFKKACSQKLEQLKTDEERSTFLKVTDITEEIERLAFHISNFQKRLARTGSIGKELDFIAQEMQREVNTLAAKTFDTVISGRVVQMKSQIEKIREQVPNAE